MVTLFYQTAIDHVYFYEIEFAKLIIRYPEPTGYSEEYLDAYSLHLYAYADAGIEKETAEEWAKKTCDLLIGK